MASYRELLNLTGKGRNHGFISPEIVTAIWSRGHWFGRCCRVTPLLIPRIGSFLQTFTATPHRQYGGD